MTHKLDRILVIDLEATCWQGEPPPDQAPEIIEIGLCILDVATLRRLENTSILVHPQRSAVSDYCTTLTTLTQADVDGGISLHEACRILEQDYQAKDRLWASFGDYDRKKFRQECQDRGIDYPFGDGHINVKSLFAVVHNLVEEVPLDRALDMLGFPLEGTYHRGDADAWNIARILGFLLQKTRA